MIRRILIAALFLIAPPVLGAELIRHSVMSDGHPLTVWEKSPKQPRAQLLLLHGRTWSSLPDFDLQVAGENLSFMDGLVAMGYRVYALDARGYGATPRDSSGWLTPDRAARDAHHVLQWISKNDSLPLHLYGWSYGSMVGHLVMQRHPSAARSMILFAYPWQEDAYPVPDADDYPDDPPRAKNTAEAAASDFVTPGSISERAIAAYVAASLEADPIRVDFRDLHQWLELDATRIQTPTLLLKGEFDPLTPMEQQVAFFAAIGTADKWFVELSGGDHAALLETPRERMLHAIDSFIRSLEK